MRITLIVMFLLVAALILFFVAVGWPQADESFWYGRGLLAEYIVTVDTDGYLLLEVKTVNYDKFTP